MTEALQLGTDFKLIEKSILERTENQIGISLVKQR
jgi:hypothetical protein